MNNTRVDSQIPPHLKKICFLIDEILAVLTEQREAYRANSLANFNTLSLKKEALTKKYQEEINRFLKTPNIKAALGSFAEEFVQKVKGLDEQLAQHILMLEMGLKVRQNYMNLFKESLLKVQRPHAATYTQKGYRCAMPKKKLAVSLSMNNAI